MKILINTSIYLLFLSLFLFDGFLGDGLGNYGLHLIPNKLSWACEIISFIIAIYFFVILAFKKRLSLSPLFLQYFIFFILFLLAGIILNNVSSGAIFAGIRRYFVFIPLFFLPTVYDFNQDEIKNQLKFLLILGLIQFPFAIYQRFFLFKFFDTGDFVTGTLLTSTVLTLYQLFCIAILSAAYIKNYIKLFTFLLLMFLLFIPTAINETKVTLFLLPIAITVPIMLGTAKIFSLKKVIFISTIGILAVSLFIPLYSYIYKTDVIDFFDMSSKEQNDRTIKGYLYKGLSKNDVFEEPGRIDALLFPFKILYKNPFKLLLGLGIGNVNSSGIGKFKGEYIKYDKYGANAIAAASIIWETGLIGFLFYLIFFCMVLIDSFKIKKSEDFFGFIAIGWIAVIIMLYLCLFYANIFHIRVIGYLFYYFSGIIVSKKDKITPSLILNEHKE